MAVRCGAGRFLPLLLVCLASCGSEEIGAPIPIDAPFATVSAGLLHTCGVTTTGTAYCWVWNRDGQLGDGSHTDRAFPVRVSRPLTFTTISAGGGHRCRSTTAHSAFCRGLPLLRQPGGSAISAYP